MRRRTMTFGEVPGGRKTHEDQGNQDEPLFLVVTIKPRLDRLDEAEAQLRVDASEHPQGAGLRVHASPAAPTTRTHG